MKALVTGASGLVGANVVRSLLERSHSVRVLVRPTSDLRALESLPIEIVQGDVLEPSTLRHAAQDQEVLFHAAAVLRLLGAQCTNAPRHRCDRYREYHTCGARRRRTTSRANLIFGGSRL